MMLVFSESGDDFDEARTVFTANFNLSAAAFTPTEKTFSWRHTAVGDQTLTLRRSTAFARLEGIGDPGSEIVISSTQSGQAINGRGRAATVMPLLIPYMMMNGHSATEVTGINVDANLLHIDTSYVRTVAEELDHTDFEYFTLTSVPSSERALLTWRRTVSLVASVLLEEPDEIPLLLSHEMSRLVAVSMLASFPYRSTRRAGNSSGAEPVGVRLAHEFIENNAHLPIGPPEIAQAAGLSIRALQRALRRYRETTPTLLIQDARLSRAHADLEAADPRLESVSAIAHKWGFLHPGRFSSTYQKRFGQQPNQTLRKFHRPRH